MENIPLAQLMSLKGKVAIVTGGAMGIGRGIVERLAEAGAKVLIADLDLEAAKKSASELHQKGWTVLSIKTDVGSEVDVKKMVEVCQEALGGIDILVNNAGIYPPEPVAKMSGEDFEKVMHVNLRSVFLTTKYVSEVMRQQGRGGKIINITSVDAIHPSMVGLAHYDASKHGVWGFTKNSALELAPDNIWVNAIAPGGINTPGVAAMQSAAPQADAEMLKKQTEAFMSKIPMHRMGEPDEIGKVALFLASDMSSYMTGEQVVVDGGVLLS
ncbi:SDR family oxidoreductase [Candidatus Berkelbacteria bacterium RIFCSPLOWO2_01_FULL_50_28]|uniref:SDR family oxidoreductase n=1 Tax=Candidatus Berkelbacteria bacterium RIFCSPLOWO2_01_FULL_50_28 TaxID=1797471 RepID=A0A1F5EAY9_9BACT|nr:MAG: SDR family oxidoreductase [Candidatus Berkelbacteria bacterium RIFCSPHIGHO2_01_FULL_50_36]OGD64446.1 MAG: SDR family oxidoreductase [Candidatus Berkelbacteria bacterium RIFCSPLOWO2_01_FULL_50_28]